jgi:hypothetical protein
MNGRPELSPKGEAEEQQAFPKGLHGL